MDTDLQKFSVGYKNFELQIYKGFQVCYGRITKSMEKGKKTVCFLSFFVPESGERIFIIYTMDTQNTVKNNLIDQKNSEKTETKSVNNNTMSPEELRQFRINNLKSFKPMSELSPEEQERQHKISVMGGKARNEQLQKHKTMRESAQQLLKATVSRDYAVKILGENADVSGIETMQDLLIAKMMCETLENGNAKAFELIRDTSGNKPTAEVDIRADIVTASDKALIDKVADRLGIVDITPDDDNENG